MPTSQYVIKDTNGESHYVAFYEANKGVQLLDESYLKRNMKDVTIPNVMSWLCAHSDTGYSVEFECKKLTEILKVCKTARKNNSAGKKANKTHKKK